MNAPWLFAEAYKYRRLHECFSISKYWQVSFYSLVLDFSIDIYFQDYDVFMRQKCDTFSRSSEAVFELFTRFVEPFVHVTGRTEEQKLEKERLMFLELTQG